MKLGLAAAMRWMVFFSMGIGIQYQRLQVKILKYKSYLMQYLATPRHTRTMQRL